MKQEDVALQTAKAYYDQLVNGDYATFVDGTLQNDSIPEDYKAQLILNMQMYIEQQNKAHQGIARVEALRATCDSVKLPNDYNNNRTGFPCTLFQGQHARGNCGTNGKEKRYLVS